MFDFKTINQSGSTHNIISHIMSDSHATNTFSNC